MLNGATIQKLNFTNRPLVVMSACETGLGKEFAGGLYGLADAWIFARAGEVVSSLWDVSDTGTDTLMHSFIDSLTNRIRSEPDRRLSGGAEYALAAAIRTTKGQLVDPAVWSAFTVYGYPSAE
jgi:CHAT domain-containing protein